MEFDAQGREFQMQIPYPYKSCNQDKQRIFGENDSQGREFREFEAINLSRWFLEKSKKIVYIIENTAQKTFLFWNSLFPLPPKWNSICD